MSKKGSNDSIRFYRNKFWFKVEKFNHPFFLPKYFAQMIGNKKSVHIADLGAAMIATTGNLWDGADIHVHASDLLADEYAEIWKDKGESQMIPVEKQDMEKLTYRDNMFDIVHCVNALDHTSDPRAALREMIRVCRPGGWIYLRHIQNEADRQSYKGMHQWNIEKKGDDCQFWNKSDRFLLSEVDVRFVTEMRSGDSSPFYPPEESVVLTMQKI